MLGVSLGGNIVGRGDTTADGVTIQAGDTTWDHLAQLDSHPLAQELRDYLLWHSGSA